jgi:hypothetical protein
MSGVRRVKFALALPRLPEGEGSASAHAGAAGVDASRSSHAGARYRWRRDRARRQQPCCGWSATSRARRRHRRFPTARQALREHLNTAIAALQSVAASLSPRSEGQEDSDGEVRATIPAAPDHRARPRPRQRRTAAVG